MILNRLEFLLMNNPIRAGLQRHVEARRFLKLGGPQAGARALEIGCGRGVGVGLILDVFGAATVDAFDLDPRMVARAQRRLGRRGQRVRLWVGDAAAIQAPDGVYDAVYDFGIIHHVPNWRGALAEVHRVLRPGGVLYAEEPLGSFLNHPLMRRMFAHPAEDRFDVADFRRALHATGLIPLRESCLWPALFWFVARKPEANQGAAPEPKVFMAVRAMPGSSAGSASRTL